MKWRLKCTIVIMRCPSSVEIASIIMFTNFLSSVVRPSLTFHIFNFSSETAEWSSTKLDRKQDLNRQRPLPSWCFLGLSEKQDGRPGLWLAETFSTSPLKLKETWHEQDPNVFYQVCVYLGQSEKQDSCPGLWLAETFSTSPLKPLNGNQRNLTGSQISKSSTKFVFFGLIGRTRWPPRPLIGWGTFDEKGLLLWNFWTEFNAEDPNRPLPSKCLLADQKKGWASCLICQKRWHIVLRCTICDPLGPFSIENLPVPLLKY